jgi:metal-responsive CopG/Arc/MetJ family transcriptional regulator
MRARYVNVSVPEEIAEKVDEYIKKSKLGYRSRAEVVIEALRRLFSEKR